MDLRQLRHLVALADCRNFGRAAEAINLSQPAFSRSIQTLERDLGCELVERSSREFRLTGQGELVLQHARRLLAGSQALHNELTQYNGLTGGELQFGCGPYPAQVLVPEALADFIDAHPAIRTRFHQGDWQQLSLWLREQQIEFFRRRCAALRQRSAVSGASAAHAAGDGFSVALAIRLPRNETCDCAPCSITRSSARAFHR